MAGSNSSDNEEHISWESGVTLREHHNDIAENSGNTEEEHFINEQASTDDIDDNEEHIFGESSETVHDYQNDIAETPGNIEEVHFINEQASTDDRHIDGNVGAIFERYRILHTPFEVDETFPRDLDGNGGAIFEGIQLLHPPVEEDERPLRDIAGNAGARFERGQLLHAPVEVDDEGDDYLWYSNDIINLRGQMSIPLMYLVEGYVLMQSIILAELRIREVVKLRLWLKKQDRV